MDTQQTLRLAAAAHAAGCTAKQIQHWLEDGINLASPPPETGQRRYSFLDVAILAVMRRLIDFGICVASANDLAHQALCKLAPAAGTEDAARSGALLQAWRDHRLQVDLISPGYYGLQRANLRKPFTMPNGPMTAPQLFALARRDIEPKTAVYLTVDIAGLLETTFNLAADVEAATVAADEALGDFATQLTRAFAQKSAE